MLTKPHIRTVNLVAGDNGVAAISDVSIEVRAGEMVALLGANGAGKTTTLMSLVGKVQKLSGSVELLGDARPGAPLHKRARAGVGLVTERRCVFSSLTCRENLLLGPGGIDRVLRDFPELEPLLGTRAGLTSGGEQQMLAVGRMLAADPKVILADEVSLGLAPLVTRRLMMSLRSAAERGAAVLVVEQHPLVALQHADRAYVLQRGRVVTEGTSSYLREHSDEIRASYF